MDPEAKKARQASKREQWEIDQKKKNSKILIPKFFITKNYWDCPEEHLKNNSADLKFLERLKMVPLVTSFPVVILDEASLQAKNSQNEETNATLKTKNSKANASKKRKKLNL